MISQETSKRIANEAKTFAESEATALAKMGLPRDQAQTACAGYYDGYIAGAEAEATRAASGIEILKELCQLKKYKDEVGKTSFYEERQPELWKLANEFLNNYNKPDK